MKTWFVLYTKPRNEKKVAENLQRLGFEAYCPLMTIERQWTDRKKKVAEPLFRSYCFVRIEEKDRKEVFRVNGVSNYVFWLGKPAIVKDEEIDEIKRWLTEYKHGEIQVQVFDIGDRVVFQKGSLMNQEALVSKINGNQLVLVLESLGYKMTVNLQEISVNKLD